MAKVLQAFLLGCAFTLSVHAAGGGLGASLAADDTCAAGAQDCALHALQTSHGVSASDRDQGEKALELSDTVPPRKALQLSDAQPPPNASGALVSNNGSAQSARAALLESNALPGLPRTMPPPPLAAPNGSLLETKRDNSSARGAALLEAYGNLSSDEVNKLFTPAYQVGCVKSTGFCASPCSQESGTRCTDNQCQCPFATCAQHGVCTFNLAEVQNAVNNGVTDVSGRVTQVAQYVPGVGDSIAGIQGYASGVANSINGIIGGMTGYNENAQCSDYISTCFFSDCDQSLGMTAECTFNTCKCKHNFCAQNGQCSFDVESALFGR
jgi:hypothetical protein